MRIKRVMLQNIRSYDISEIEFPEGTVLLSGDIGSGKSSALLAIEFALFGLQRGVGGNILLRNGKNVGGVKLELEIDGKNVKIERVLKRVKDAIKQDQCFLEVDGKKEDLSSTELKSKVLTLLDYPQELLSKNPILYRYTVYTPQEEMKSILQEDSSLRLNTLRRVFGIDKYKRVIENIGLVSSKIKEGIKEKEGRIVDLEDKKSEIKSRKEEQVKVKNEISKLKVELERFAERINNKKTKLLEIERQISSLNDLKNEHSRISGELKSKKEQKSDNEENISELKDKISSFERKIKESNLDVKDLGKVSEELKAKEKLLNELDKKYIEINREIAGYEATKTSFDRVVKSVTSLDNCPTCKQKVSAEHKHEIKNSNEKEIADLNEKISRCKKSRDEADNSKKETIKEINDLRIKERNLHVIKVEFDRFEENKKSLLRFDGLGKQIIDRIKELELKVEETNVKLNSFKDLEKNYSDAKEWLDAEKEGQKKVEISKARCERQFEDLTYLISNIEKEIDEKEKIKLKIAKLKKIRDWLSAQFVMTVEAIEKAVMSKVHHEFSLLFGKWFSMLAEGLNARINEEFTPIIEQQGYEIEYNYLSGGERTAAALAYRLALNQVINSLMSEIKTKDILILDEPTDGFSYEQLDKMRDVLNELKIKQLILVSHETKIESFVEKIIRFEKDEVTKVVN